MPKIRNCIESDILKKLGGTDRQCRGTRNAILNDIVIILGGTVTSRRNRNALLRDVLATLN